MAGFSEFVPGGDTHHLVALREDCDSRAAAPEAQFAFDVAVSWKYGNGRFSQTGTFSAFLMCARLLLFCFQCFLGNASLSSQAFAEAAPDSTPALPQIEEKGTKTAGVGSSVARSDRSVPQARLATTSPSGGHTAPICSSCAAVHVCVESGRPTPPSISAFRCPRIRSSKSAQSCKK